MTLAVEDFATAFWAVHGVPPFAWQARLLREVLADGWPETVAAPTGAGKTAVLDVALFALALELARGGRRRSPLRIVFAVDRRVIVDQAYRRAKLLRRALAHAQAGPLAAMAAALRGGIQEVPLHVAVLRGGMPREDDWALSPAQPTVLCTTVDQLGSRLLFRGYGVSDSMAPIHAGLLGSDALLLLDEAHLSNPFRETLEAIGRRRVPGDCDLGLPWASCLLTATPRPGARRIFRLNDTEQAEPVIAQRLAAAKQAVLREVKEPFGSNGHAEALVEAALHVMEQCTRPAPTVAVIVNRVALARNVFARLQVPEPDKILLTGRVRPVERDDLLAKHGARLSGEANTSVTGAAQPLFVVATQCIEAGADFDFDGMVTQLAPLDALRQRFGRLNRRGQRTVAPAAIIATHDAIARGTKVDALYGDRSKLTWEWLLARATAPTTRHGAPTLAVGPNDFARWEAADEAASFACASPAPSAPVLRGADVAFFARTNPPPHPDPYLPLFLHGPTDDTAEVAIVWRADLAETDLDDTKQGELARAAVVTLPPRTGEALQVPIWAARAWLARKANFDFSDTEAEPAQVAELLSGGKRCLRWRGADDSRVVEAADLRPGDTILVPAAYGGCDQFGWAPDDPGPVADIADRAAAPYASRYAALRLHQGLWHTDGNQVPWSDVKQLLGEVADDGANAILDELSTLGIIPTAIAELAADLGGAQMPRVLRYGEADTDGLVLIAPRGIPMKTDDEAIATASTEDELSGAFARGRAVTLHDHAASVETMTSAFATCLGLPALVTEALAFAARHHDDGKLDPRFQAWLGVSPGPAAEPLAKSGIWRGLGGERAARELAGLPPQWRHEVLSVRLAALHLDKLASTQGDSDLALFLIGSHHGQGRPFFAHQDGWDAHERTVGTLRLGPGSGPERLDFDWRGNDWPSLFAALQRRYGVWGLAFLEAVLRLADHRASEAAP